MTISVSLILCRSYLHFSFFSLLPLRTYRMAHSFILLLCPIFFILVHAIHKLFTVFPISFPYISPFLTFSLVHKLQHPLFYSLSRQISFSVDQPQSRSLYLALSPSLFFSVPFVSMQPPSVRDGSAGHGELEKRARAAMFTRFGGVSLSDITHSYRYTL